MSLTQLFNRKNKLIMPNEQEAELLPDKIEEADSPVVISIDSVIGSNLYEHRILKSCHCCSRRRYWKSIAGRIICGICHPPAHRGLVKKWLG